LLAANHTAVVDGSQPTRQTIAAHLALSLQKEKVCDFAERDADVEQFDFSNVWGDIAQMNHSGSAVGGI